MSIGQVEIPLSATGGDGTYTWSIISGSLPTGLALRTDLGPFSPPGAAAGLIGVATVPGTYNFTLRVSSGGFDTDQSLDHQDQRPVNRTGQAPDAFVGVPYSYTLAAFGNTNPVTWTATGAPGALPAGLTMSAAGVISGTPTTSGSYNAGLQLNDGTASVMSAVTINVSNVYIPTAGRLPNATQGSVYTTRP